MHRTALNDAYPMHAGSRVLAQLAEAAYSARGVYLALDDAETYAHSEYKAHDTAQNAEQLARVRSLADGAYRHWQHIEEAAAPMLDAYNASMAAEVAAEMEARDVNAPTLSEFHRAYDAAPEGALVGLCMRCMLPFAGESCPRCDVPAEATGEAVPAKCRGCGWYGLASHSDCPSCGAVALSGISFAQLEQALGKPDHVWDPNAGAEPDPEAVLAEVRFTNAVLSTSETDPAQDEPVISPFNYFGAPPNTAGDPRNRVHWGTFYSTGEARVSHAAGADFPFGVEVAAYVGDRKVWIWMPSPWHTGKPLRFMSAGEAQDWIVGHYTHPF